MVTSIFQRAVGILSKRAEQVFWYLYNNGEARFNELKKEFGMNQKVLNETLKKLMEKNVVVKKDKKYFLSPTFSTSIDSMINFEYIKQNNPCITGLYTHYHARDMNIHLVCGFEKHDNTIKEILNQLNISFNILRRLKATREYEKNENIVTKEAFIHTLSIIFSQVIHEYLMDKAFRIDKPLTQDKILLFYQKLTEALSKIAKELWNEEIITEDIIQTLNEYASSVKKEDIRNYPEPASNGVAILSTPSFIQYKASIDIHSIYKDMNKIIYPYKKYLEMEYGNALEIYTKEIPYRRGMYPNKVWKIGVLLFMITQALKESENLEMAEYEVKEQLKKYFPNEVDFIWKIYKKYRREDYFIPAWIRIIWYEYLKNNPKNAAFVSYQKKIKKMVKREDYEEYHSLLHKIQDFPDKEKALEVIEYLIGEQICREYKEYWEEKATESEERKYVE